MNKSINLNRENLYSGQMLRLLERGSHLNGAPAARRHFLRAAATPSSRGPEEFFQPGQEGESRQSLFNTISPVYDELNDRLSFGLHRVWKRMAVQWSGAARGNTVVDVCCGSGDLAFLLAAAVGPQGKVGQGKKCLTVLQ
jgi:hypothetical protein